MKTILGIAIGIIAVVWVIVRVFGAYNSNAILSNEASFEVLVDSNSFDADEFFGLPEGTFDPEKHILICKLPVETEGFRPSHVSVRTDIENIACNTKVEKGQYIQYQPYELKD